jgi:hypothetical protein
MEAFMKRVVSISLGSSKRDHQITQEFAGQTIKIERIGTDGDKRKAIELIRQLDGNVDAFGLGGTDLYIYAGSRRYTFRESAAIASAAKKTPVVDGSGIKNSLERRVVKYLEAKTDMNFKGKNILVVCAVDRFGLAESLVDAGARTVFGDLLFGLGLPLPIRSLKNLDRLARVVAPIITLLPISLFYPTGKEQTEFKPRFGQYFDRADVIAGDFHFIRRYMPSQLNGQTIITNTVTKEDQALLQQRGVGTLVTTTPDMGGRSLGTNVLEAVLVALAGKEPSKIGPSEYDTLLDEIRVEPRLVRLN